jgi:hypothetical protein
MTALPFDANRVQPCFVARYVDGRKEKRPGSDELPGLP